ncbi:hypothetical protein [Sphingomonas sp. NIBR02145]|uniref:hypothetical protein n=1 Tax=Sphingomonas sp. NIBR02145 TaxID=3014784 RepID=UPI0022B2FB40|nr:hypothetical protein [Sphingomonas sp. NIBR02145]WHU03618.1 hypothetical protein O3305_03175 [Sphingomonas sp. NIBR02145]
MGFLLALTLGGMLVSGWEIRRGIAEGRVRFQAGFIERTRSPKSFWLWFAILVAIFAGMGVFSFATLSLIARNGL